MKKQIITGYLLILAAIGFWISWFLMPDPGTTDTVHILAIVKQSRTSVLSSVVIQIISSVLYAVAILFMLRIFIPKKNTMIGMVLFAIGVLGLCADAFFHLLAWFMTDDTVTIQQDVVRVMEFMQTDALILLVPLLLPFFIGNIVLSFGLNKQGNISQMPKLLFLTSLVIGVVSVMAAKTLVYQGPVLTIIALGLFAGAQIIIGLDLMKQTSTVRTK